MLIQDRIENNISVYMLCNEAGLLVTMHPLRRLAMSANIVINSCFGCRGFYLVRSTIVCVCVCFFPSFWTSMDVPAGVTQEEGNTGFSIQLLSAVLALIFLARRIQPFLSLVDREVEFFVY